MYTYISILRGINVGGKRKIKMAELKELYSKLNFLNITSYIQSGNVIFNSEVKEDCNKISAQIEKAILNTFGFEVPVIVKTSDELKQAISDNPFSFVEEKERLHLTFLSEIPSSEKAKLLKKFNFDPDQFKIIGKNTFIYCNGKYSESKLTNNFLETKLNVLCTTRNWKTVLQLYELVKINELNN